jgi:hypothetical protein
MSQRVVRSLAEPNVLKVVYSTCEECGVTDFGECVDDCRCVWCVDFF